MPSLGADMADGTFVEWKIAPGDRVARGDVVCVVETDKGAVDVEVWETGTVSELVAQPGERIAVGGLLARLEATRPAQPREPVSAAAAPRPAVAAADASRAAPGPAEPAPADAAPPPAKPRPGVPLRISPAARQRARALGIDPDAIPAPPDGRAVAIADVEALAARSGAPAWLAAVPPLGSPSTPPPMPSDAGADSRPTARAPAVSARAGDGEARPGADARQRMRAAIASAMTRANRDIPHYYLSTQATVEDALRWLEQYNAGRPITERVLFAAVQLKAVALALREAPEFNGWFVDGHFKVSPAIHPGVAISLRGGGLVAPALHDADRLALPELMSALRDLVTRARGGQLRSSELADATITVTNLGELGVETVFGVIYPPQLALVGFGCVSERACAADGRLYAARCVDITLAADHRASDGMRGARFLAALRGLLEDPASWAESTASGSTTP